MNYEHDSLFIYLNEDQDIFGFQFFFLNVTFTVLKCEETNSYESKAAMFLLGVIRVMIQLMCITQNFVIVHNKRITLLAL